MKRSFQVIIVVFFLPLMAYAYNPQKTYPVESIQWRMTDSIARNFGVAGPSSAGPITVAQLQLANQRFEPLAISSSEKELVDSLVLLQTEEEALFRTKGFSGLLRPVLSPEIYLQNDNDTSLASRDWILKPYSKRLPFASLEGELNFFDTVYGFVEFTFQKNLSDEQFTGIFNYNLPLKMYQLQKMMPFKTGLVAGNSWMNFTIARDQLSVGSARTGNMHIGDNFAFQEFLKLSMFNKFFTYTLSLTHFDQQIDATTLEKFRFQGWHQTRVSHTYSFTFFDRFVLSLHEGNMVQSDSMFDWRMLNPFMFLHNWNNYEELVDSDGNPLFESNNYFTLELGYTFLPHWQLTAQAVIDQIQVGGEVSGQLIDPNAWGALLNLTASYPIGNGMMDFWLEAAYTSPYLYLMDKVRNGTINWNNDLIVGYYLPYGSDISYTGYIHGPDSLVIALGTQFMNFTPMTATGQILYKIHGQKGIAYDNQTANVDKNTNPNPAFLTGIMEHSLEATASFSMQVYRGINVQTTVAFVNRWNYKNIVGNVWTDLQFSAACSLDIGKLCKWY